jgi:hypothetical protein
MKILIKTISLLAIMTTTALADSCWTHNGSLMRLQADGNNRWFSYENPKSSLYPSGVQPGTLLFNGQNNGDWYSGLARVFSKYCVGNPLEYWVEGPVSRNPLRITMTGTREKSRQCVSTGVITTDTLVFTYSHQC